MDIALIPVQVFAVVLFFAALVFLAYLIERLACILFNTLRYRTFLRWNDERIHW
jgi:hypothetical protein